MIKSDRAKKILASAKGRLESPDSPMRKYKIPGRELFFKLELESNIVKKLSYFGEFSQDEIILIETIGMLILGKSPRFFSELSLREIDFYLRDKNSVPSFDQLEDTLFMKNLLDFLSNWPLTLELKDYQFQAPRGGFRAMGLADKVKEFHSFLRSHEVAALFPEGAPRLIDLDDLTVYIETSTRTSEEKKRFEELHLLAVSVFQEEELNLIPEENL